jgi:uncharacterized repeat protein (TIGR01451 family)
MLRNWLTKLQSIVRTPARRNSWKRPAKRQVGRFISPAAAQVLEDRTLLSFTPIAQPDAAYTGGTVNLAGSIPGDGAFVGAVTDGTETVTFSSSVGTGTVPASWSTWNSPPATESATPRVLEAIGANSLTLTLSDPASTFGIELEPASFGVSNFTADFYEGATLVGSIAQGVEGNAGALLFGASTDQAFTSVVITADASAGGFAMAQPRYALAEADLSITKTADVSQVNPDHTLTYTIDVTNNGPNDAVNAAVADSLPTGTTFISATAPAGWTTTTPAVGSNGDVLFVDSSLASGATASFTIVVKVDASVSPANEISNTASTGSDTHDGTPVNNIATATTLVVPLYVVVNGDNLDNEFLIKNDGNGFVDFYKDGVLQTHQLASTIVQASVNGLGGNDRLTVDSSNGLIVFTGIDFNDPTAEHRINFDGGDGFDRLDLVQTGGPTRTSSRINVGAEPGSGQSVIDTQTINFTGLEPITDSVAATTFTLSSVPGIASLLDADNAVNYTASQIIVNGGRITVDNFEPVEFINKANLVIDAGAGSDEINLNNPSTPTGLTGITVNGGDPTGSDTVIVNGTSGVDNVTVDQMTIDGARVTGAGPVPITVASAEHLIYSGQGGFDNLTVTMPANSDIDYFPGAVADAGTILGRLGANLLPVEFQGLGSAVSSSVTLASNGGGRTNFLTLHGTAENDDFSVSSAGQLQMTHANVGAATPPINTPGITGLTLVGMDGDDTFNLSGNHPFTQFSVQGGNPSASDVLNFNGTGGDVTVNLQAGTVQEAGFGAVSLSGVETLNVNAGAGAISVVGRSTAETLDVTPTGANTATIVASGLNLVVNTNNTGTLTIDTSGGSDTVVVNGTAAADTIDVLRGATSTVQVNALKQVGVLTPLGNPDALVVNAGLGDDFINVSGSAGPQSLVVDGGLPTASDTLTITNGITGTTTVSPGSTPDAGVISNNDGAVTFAGIELISIISADPTDNITFQGTHDNDTIALQRLGGANRVWVNDRAVVSFTNFDDVTLQGRFGDDSFSVTPTGLVGVATISVAGGDPTASDTVIVNGTTGLDNVTIDQLTLDGARVTGLGPVVNIATSEHLIYNGQGADDAITYITPAGLTSIQYTPGVDLSAGRIDSRQVGGNPLLSFEHVNTGGTSTITLQDVGGGRDDRLLFNGTSAPDVFVVTAAGTVQIQLPGATIPIRTPLIDASGVNQLRLFGFDGDDTFAIPGNHPFTGGGNPGIMIDGGDPSASDVLNFTGTGGDVTVDLQAGTVQEAGFGAVSLVGVEEVNVSAASGNVTVVGTTGDDDLTVTPGAANDAVVTASGLNTVFHLTGVGTLSIDGNGGSSDTLSVNATSAADTIAANGTSVAITGRETVNFIDIDALKLYGLQGSDTITVDASAIPVFVDGGNPIGVLPGDFLMVNGVGVVTLFGGPENDEGGVQIGANAPVSYDHIESLAVGGGGPVVVMGTNGNDVITIIARDSDYSPMADGIQDWTISVNNGPAVLNINKPSVIVNSLSGNDEIVIIQRDPDPTTAPAGPWDVDVTVDGGQPPAGSDQVIIGTPNGMDVVTYSPTDSDSATFVNTTQNSTVIINNVEHTIYDGQGGNDDLTVITPTGGSEINLTPGALLDQGAITFFHSNGALLPLNYEDLGIGLHLTFADAGGTRVDQLKIIESDASNGFLVDSSGEIDLFPINGGLAVPINTPGVGSLVLQGNDGDDRFIVSGNHPFAAGILIDAGDPSASDILDFGGGGASIRVDLGPQTVRETGFGPVSILGVETVNIFATSAPLTVFGTDTDDTITYRPTGATAGTFSKDGQNTVYNFQNAGTTATAGAFTIELLGDVADRVILVGTNNHDVITINSPARTAIVQNAAGTDYKQVTLGQSVEILSAQGLLGNDTFIVIPAPALGAGLQIDVDGGLPGASDTLVIGSNANGAPLPATDFAIVAPGLNPGEGRVRVFRNAVAMPDISYSGVEIVFANVANDANGDPQRLIFGPDPNEPNDARTDATHIGAGEALNGDNLSIFSTTTENFPPFLPIADQDWFQVVAKETGVLDVQIFHDAIPLGLVPGDGRLDVRIRDASGDLIASALGFTGNVKIAVPVVRNQIYYVQVSGTTAAAAVGYEMTVLNIPAPVPQTIDLQAASDSGRSDTDDITNVALATFDIVLNDDRFDEFTFLNLLPDTVNDDIQTAGFDYGVEVFNNGVSIGFAFYTGTGNLWQFTAGPGDLLEGHNNFLTAAVWVRDRATPSVVGTSDQQGPINALQVTLDTIAPLAPTITIDPLNTDTGVDGFDFTLTDRITSDTTTGFFGVAEADTIIRLFGNANPLGLTVTLPYDGDEAFPNGQWELVPNLDFNDPIFGMRDGLRIITGTAEDIAGNVGEPGRLDIFIDTQGPQVFDPDAAGPQQAIQVVTNGVVNPTYDLFNLKGQNALIGPTPRIDGLLINIQDQPPRIASFLYEAVLAGVAVNPGNYQVVGDRVGVVAITSVVVTNNAPVAGQPATATIQLNFAEPLEDDRFTLTIFDSVQDRAGNAFDGESNANEPSGNPTFPSGNGIAGGDFSARFTVDSRAEIGVWGQAGIQVDANQNFQLDPTVTGGVAYDPTRDLQFQFGLQTDAIFAGQFHPNGGVSNGFDRLGAYGLANGKYRFLLDFNDDGVPDVTIISNVQVNALPLAGDFSNDGLGDEIGLFDGVTWYLDTNGDNVLDTSFSGNMRGLPFAGDFDGDGLTDLGTFIANTNSFQFDLAWDGIDGNADQGFGFGFPGVLERPFAGDFNLDGVDDVGLTTPSQTGTDGPLEWYILISQGTPVAGNVDTLNHEFSPTPVGGDFAGHFGSGQQLPVVGNFDPPLAVSAPADIGGQYLFSGKTTQVLQSGGLLTFKNENGGTSSGYFLNASQVVASNWGNLVGNLVDGAIAWTNGSTWTKISTSIAGEYSFNGQSTVIEQSGSDLVFHNENGGTSRGHFLSATQVVATDWGNLVGNLVDGNIQWKNGSLWTWGAPTTQQIPLIAGTYTFAGKMTTVEQSGSDLVFHNENGGTSRGHFVSATQIVATDWGNLVGNLVDGNIQWKNGSLWTWGAPATQQFPLIAGTYTFAGKMTTVEQSGSDLVFHNENGGSSRGHFVSATQLVATDWGNLVGDLVGGNIQWKNGSVWQPLALDNLFAAFDEWDLAA